ncbi:multidrug ABC transporter ATP-binding protein [Kroppenstedtia guangzhouensis]|uniref:Multidrug ABC transporter ATP-binding protein n=1 Tax=Kroppenstedtia guangzhouensis TaxID=1274356 RepID=A0ABQ1GRJ4_9BACL|nr:ABC-F family ATP-binding cassette domain-containing protein [Kroppenstedtia guangzhouensis]GGA49027.1 multidrug ABC transporter ATP-binding protein [Kroppenstedtia guangzhouensis]
MKLSILQVNHIDKSFGATPVLKGISLKVEEKERVGLIGPNGAGKSTLLKVITSRIPADSGEIHISKKARVGYLAQSIEPDAEGTVWDEVMKAFLHLREMETQLRDLEQEMGRPSVLADEKRYLQVTEQYARLQESFEQAGGYSHEARARGTLTGLGLGGLDWKKTSVHAISGGQKTRLALARLLLEQPDLIILDEPTNYLDMDALAWLEQTLESYPGALLVVSHDRYFLDRIVSVIYELDRTRITRYKGNYTQYIRQREEQNVRQEKAYEQQQQEIRRMEEFVRRNMARASTTKRAQSRQKALERMERIERPPGDRKKAAIRFIPSVTSGQQVLETEELTVGYDSAHPLIAPARLRLKRGDRIALLGPNGAGKSSLLKTLVGSLPPLSGKITFGTQVRLDFYDQEQEELNEKQTVLEEVWNAHPRLDQTQIRSYLGQFLFTGEEVFKRVSSLSGGEKARLSLLKRLLNRANLLLMDEPTNHLDLESKERLEEGLESFPGTLLFVSHDRYFINRLATGIWEVKDGRITVFDGSYEEFLEQKKESPTSNTDSAKPVADDTEETRKKRMREREDRRRREEAVRLEEEIEALEKEKARIQEELCREEIYTRPEESLPRQRRLIELEASLAEKTERWAEIAE